MEDLHDEDYLQIEQNNLEFAKASCLAGVIILGLTLAYGLYLAIEGLLK